MPEKSVIIIGAGIAGLCAGCYGQMNGYHTQIFELHDKPGGLCTAWQRKGYTIDGCIHWLVGSGPGTDFYRFWQEVGALQSSEIKYMDQFMRFEDSSGKVFTIYTDIDKLEQHMIEISPADTRFIKEFIGGIRTFTHFKLTIDKAPELYNLIDMLKLLITAIPHWGQLSKWTRLSMNDFASRFQSSILREALLGVWPPEFPVFFVMITLAWMHMKNAGYPLGGSLPFARAIEKRYLDSGGKINYKSQVVNILVENNHAIGIRLQDGNEYRADYVISAADGHATIFDMLGGKYVNNKICSYYDHLATFDPLLFIALGINRSFDDMPQVISGTGFPLEKPVTIAGKELKHLNVRIHNFDPTLSPPGKTVITVMIPAEYTYWKSLYENREHYKLEKEEITDKIVQALEKRFPGLASQVEMKDIATPVTFHRYTNNWKGSFEGWMITPKTWNLRMSKTLPGLNNFYMTGQWVEPGGGLPTSLMSGRNVVQIICKRDKKPFVTTIPA